MAWSFAPNRFRGSSFSELFVPLSIFATSLADLIPRNGIRCADRCDAATSRAQDKRRLRDDNRILGNSDP
ncbi:MAG: hypothetical protein DMF00_10145 [Verrucomicrobia bacterium]|nr:MAG: hypothetical protein DMF00_10145 [Verrucomicrobiota bacterium]